LRFAIQGKRKRETRQFEGTGQIVCGAEQGKRRTQQVAERKKKRETRQFEGTG
jgi:hypothetical protein